MSLIILISFYSLNEHLGMMVHEVHKKPYNKKIFIYLVTIMNFNKKICTFKFVIIWLKKSKKLPCLHFQKKNLIFSSYFQWIHFYLILIAHILPSLIFWVTEIILHIIYRFFCSLLCNPLLCVRKKYVPYKKKRIWMPVDQLVPRLV